MSNQNKVDQLVNAGVLATPVTPEVEKLVDDLTEAEVNSLIAVKQKLGITGTLNKPGHDIPMCGF